MKENIQRIYKGLHTDNSYIDQPKDTYTMALNAVEETGEGDSNFISNEESNEQYINLPIGFSPIGKVYIGNGQTVLFLVSNDNTVSEIGLLDKDRTYTTQVNDESSEDKLDFHISKQIDAVYRLRRGCGRTIYFVGKDYPVRYYNLDKPHHFKKDDKWVASKFDLHKKLNTLPQIEEIEVLENNGNLKAGSYDVLIQHLDEGMNGTKFIELVSNIKIYNSSFKDSYQDIEGSSSFKDGDNDIFYYEHTDKSIKIIPKNLDENYPYVRFAIIEKISGLGTITSVKYSEPLSSTNPIYIYTGLNGNEESTIEFTELFNEVEPIESAEHIEQIDNRLILANTKGSQAKIENLQKYASLIKTDCFIKKVALHDIKDPHNYKNPLVDYNGIGYQPGEIYSLGIIYVFSDNTYSPVYHIPGKSPLIDEGTIYSQEEGSYPMSKNNESLYEKYINNASCKNIDYWGVDSEGDKLEGNSVRHHRFPTRKDIGVSFVDKISDNEDRVKYTRLSLESHKLPTHPIQDEVSAETIKLSFDIEKDGNIENIEYYFNLLSDEDKHTFYTDYYDVEKDYLTNIKIYRVTYNEEDEVLTEIPLSDSVGIVDVKYVVSINKEDSLKNNSIVNYTSNIFGIRFSGVILPPEEEIGKKVIGYRIVRQERREKDKTILDSAVVFPMTQDKDNISTALLAPEYYNGHFGTPTTMDEGIPLDARFPTKYKIARKSVMLLTPQHKFKNKTFDDFTSIEAVGMYQQEYVSRDGVSIQNIQEGSSDGGDSDKATSDSDGYTLKHGFRFTGVEYKTSLSKEYNISNEETTMYDLEGVNYSQASDNKSTLYNLAMDNKALILFKNKEDADLRSYGPTNKHTFPYVYIKKDNNLAYNNFRSHPYYFIDSKIHTEDSCDVFGGDTYISPLRYSNHVFGNGVAGMRREKVSTWKVLGSILGIVAGVAVAIFTGGTGTGATLAIIGGISAALGSALMLGSTILKAHKFSEIYGEKWQNNIDKTVLDYMYAKLFIRQYPQTTISSKHGNDRYYQYWRDDTIKWFGDIIGDLWFESQINMSLRVSPRKMDQNYLKPLESYMDNNGRWLSITSTKWIDSQFLGNNGFRAYNDHKTTGLISENHYFINKITEKDNNKNSGYSYVGISVPIVYMSNPDYDINTRVKKFYTIPLEYDFCSKCREKFPHRWHWSEQSFQEELTDNYRIFLPNNYKDLDGENGKITNLIILNNTLYIHTEEGLWMQPRTTQERITDQIVSFIGTGEFGSLPARKILDDKNGNSAGLQHKWGTLQNSYGYFFPCESQNKVYQFTGQLKPISDIGQENWFQENMPIYMDKQYYNSNKKDYPFKDNPSNYYGTGFIMTYDSTKERIILTKKDSYFSNEISDLENYNLCINEAGLTVFLDVENTKKEQLEQGWIFDSIENCKMKFFKEVLKTKTEIRKIIKRKEVGENTDVYVILDSTNSFNSTQLENIETAATSLKDNFKSFFPSWEGGFFIVRKNTEAWWNFVNYIDGEYTDEQKKGKNIVMLSFTNEADTFNEKKVDFSKNLTPTTNNQNAYVNFRDNIYPKYKSFVGILYPIYSNVGYIDETRSNIIHSIGTVCGTNTKYLDKALEKRNDVFTAEEWKLVKDMCYNKNNYNFSMKEEFNWAGVYHRSFTTQGEQIITSKELKQDIVPILKESQEIIEIIEEEVITQYYDREYKYVGGNVVENPIEYDNGWTISFSLKSNFWKSLHSYIPNFYIHTAENFYSWVYFSPSIWKHNKKGHFQTFYGKKYPFIVEYVDLSNPLQTKITNHLKLITEAKEWNEESKEYLDKRDITFNQALFYNSRQTTGLLNLIIKNKEFKENYLLDQVKNLKQNEIIIDRNERDWSLNDLRDYRINYNKPMFNTSLEKRQENYYIDKVLNQGVIDYNKDWTQLEKFRDKYLIIRLIFNTFDNIKLIFNYSSKNESLSHR